MLKRAIIFLAFAFFIAPGPVWAEPQDKQGLPAAYAWEPFQQVDRPAVPATARDAASWVRNPIDAFLAAEHAKRGLKPRPEASQQVLLRRVYLDLIGLPPTPDELHAFLEDPAPDAYEKVVDRLLSSPRYGERWGRHWMDVWRYSDWAGWTDGGQIRDSQPHIWRWRDWIIESLNADKGYDRMILEMLAGDELAPGDPDALRATGYLARNYKMLSREIWLQETVDHTAQAFLGVRLGCARCHDHKYDPITQKEYYQFRAFFEPHNVRLDRVAGEADTTKDGLARVYDADPGQPTFLYVRGDDRTPDKEHPLEPGVPAALGGAPRRIEPVALPLAAYVPEKAEYVVRETIAASEQAAAQARAGLEAARQAEAAAARDRTAAAHAAEQARARLAEAQQAAASGATAGRAAAAAELEQARQAADKAAQDAAQTDQAWAAAREQLALAELAAPTAQSRHAALVATIAVERIEDSGDRARHPDAWNQAALAASSAQHWAAVLGGVHDAELARHAVERGETAAAAAQQAAHAKPGDAKLKNAAEQAAKVLTDARAKRTEADQQLVAAKQAVLLPRSAEYTKRPLKTYPAASTGRRLALARWIADRKNPLTARVAVNHIWLRHFGAALVPSVFDFGQNGRPATHPALLDWLAAELMAPSLGQPANAWSMKHLHRLIVTSSAYRMASTPDPANLVADPENHYLWRMNSRRVEAEVVRDCVLHVAAQLDLNMGGPELDHQKGLVIQRRSIYFRHAAEKQMEFLKLFDAAGVTECYERRASIVPQQALALANSALTLAQARILARSLAGSAGSDANAFIVSGFEHVLARRPTAAETDECRAFLERQTRLYADEAARGATATRDVADASRPSADAALRARETLVHALMNHNDFVTVR